MRQSKVNKAWHDAHVMPRNPTRAQRVAWHAEHSQNCGCREVPSSLVSDVKAVNKKKASRTN